MQHQLDHCIMLQKKVLWSVHSKDCSADDQPHTMPASWLLLPDQSAWMWCVALA